VGVGLFIAAVWAEVIVLTDEADEDRAGELGRRERYGAGDNGGREVGASFPEGVEVGIVGVEAEVGVGVPEPWEMGPVYRSPNSPGANITTEQNPSVDVISNVSPSEDLGNSISIEQYRNHRIDTPSEICKCSIV
jgi:hypothetical protein